MREPNFDNMLRVLERKKPSRPTLFEFFLNTPLNERITGEKLTAEPGSLESKRHNMRAYYKAGYDYSTLLTGFKFGRPTSPSEESISLNDGAIVTDRKSLETVKWKRPDDFDYSEIDILAKELPKGMKFIEFAPGGVLENLVWWVGFDNLCFMLVDDPGLVQDIVDAIGSRLLRHYEILGQFESVGAMIVNDDWGFKTQPMLSPDDMRKYIVPWHKKIVEAIHKSGKPAIMHSCGNLKDLMDDIIDEIGFDGKHSYEDNIKPVEEAYEMWGNRIAIIGGIDVDFLCRNTPDLIRERSRQMLKRTADRGGYALGSGNSIPEYVPQDSYFAMTSVALQA
ncbi:MAG TPA: uroporphyrinogen decarboxylase family protein [Victivallales bacterium]|nr:uroporphyrinogen decarboxylase family protein [Victivallales bacterium]